MWVSRKYLTRIVRCCLSFEIKHVRRTVDAGMGGSTIVNNAQVTGVTEAEVDPADDRRRRRLAEAALHPVALELDSAVATAPRTAGAQNLNSSSLNSGERA